MTFKSKHAAIRWLSFLLILLCGTLLRISYNASTVPDGYIRGDSKSYLHYANNLIQHSTFSKDLSSPPDRDSYWAPGYPLFLALVFKVSETHSTDDIKVRQFGREAFDAILFAQVILGAGTILVCFLLAASFLPGYWSLFPPLLVSISPHLVSTGYYILTETLFGFLLLSSIYLLVKALESRGYILWATAGVSAGLTYLVNPVSLFLAPLLAVSLCPRAMNPQFGARSHRRKLLVYLLPVLLTVAGWTVRNVVSVPEHQPSSGERLLTNLASGLYSDFHEKWAGITEGRATDAALPGSDIHSYTQFIHALSKKVSTQPIETLKWYLVQKPALLFDWEIVVGQGDIYIYRVLRSLYDSSLIAIASYSLMKSLHVWLLLAAFLGLTYLCRGKNEDLLVPRLIYLGLSYISLVYVATQAAPRYSIPLRPELYICCVFFVWKTSLLVSRLKG